MIIDVHCHYAFTALRPTEGERFSFEPPEPEGYDSCLAPRVLRRPSTHLARHLFGLGALPPSGPALDAALETWYARHLLAPGPIDRHVLLAFDAYHDENGRRPPWPRHRRQRGSDMYTSNTLVRAACRRHPERWLFGASVHPYRENALACLDEVFAAGACLIKWMPLHQNIHPADPRTRAALRRCSELGLPVLLHCGDEFTLATQHPAFRPVAPWLELLRSLRTEGCMPVTIIAHVGTPATPLGDRTTHRLVVEALLGEFADAPLYADLAALTAWTKIGYLRRLVRRQPLHAKLLFGTDFPVPLALPRLRRDLGSQAWRRIAASPSWAQQAAAVYLELGFNEIVFHRAETLLPNLDFFQKAA